MGIRLFSFRFNFSSLDSTLVKSPKNFVHQDDIERVRERYVDVKNKKKKKKLVEFDFLMKEMT